MLLIIIPLQSTIESGVQRECMQNHIIVYMKLLTICLHRNTVKGLKRSSMSMKFYNTCSAVYNTIHTQRAEWSVSSLYCGRCGPVIEASAWVVVQRDSQQQ